MTEQPTPLLQLKAARKVYRTDTIATLALNDISLTVNQGEYLAVIGRSGSGKSTLLSILGLLDTLDSGHYRFADQDVDNLSRHQQAKLRCEKIGFVFQFFHLISDLSVADNIALPMTLAQRPAPEIKHRVTELLEQVSLNHRQNHFPGQLSGGQQQRVAIARALANDPPLLLVDEPTGNLDLESGEQIMTILSELNREGRTLLMVTHDMTIARKAQRQVRMTDGNLEPELLSQALPAHNQTKSFL